MRYWAEMIESAEKLNLYTIWAMMAHAHEINAAYPISKNDWFLNYQVGSLLKFVESAENYLEVLSVSIDQFTVEFVLNGLTWEAQMCMADSDTTLYYREYSRAAEFLRDKLAEKFKC